MLFARFGKITFALIALWLCAAARPAQAQIDIVNNLSTTTANADRIGANLWQADSFQTPNATYLLTAATLKLSSISGGTVTVDLYSNTGTNKPGSPLVTLGTSGALSTALADITFTPVGVQTLQANTVYWIVAHSLTSADWGATASTFYTGVGTIPADFAFAASADSGSTWSTQGIGRGPNQFRVQATTPEPGAMALVTGMSVAGIYTFRRRRRTC
jgi:hypothetical protein